MNETNGKTGSADISVYTSDPAVRAWFVRLIANTAAHGNTPYDGRPTKEQLFGLFHLAQRHSILPIVAHGLLENDLLEDEKTKKLWQNIRDTTLLRHVGKDVLTKQIMDAFEENGIDYVLLKGAAIRPLYPEPFMRSSSDIDILVREETADKAADLLVQTCGMEKQSREYHNIKLVKPKTAILELHFSIMEDDKRMDPVLKDVWLHTERVGDTHEYRLTPEFFLFHQLTHAAHHMDSAGCGIRPFLDMYLIRRAMTIDEASLSALCEKCGLSVFRKEVETLGDHWFGGAKPGENTAVIAEYVLGNRLFGTREQRVAAARDSRGKIRYIFGRLFVSRSRLEQQYPALKSKPFLLPYYEIKRLFEAVFPRKRAAIFARELVENDKVPQSAIESEAGIRRILGLR